LRGKKAQPGLVPLGYHTQKTGLINGGKLGDDDQGGRVVKKKRKRKEIFFRCRRKGLTIGEQVDCQRRKPS